MIGDGIEVTVLSIDGAKVRIGIEASSDVPVFRTEIYVEIQRERRRSAAAEDVRSEVEDELRGLGGPSE
jgi:carbon storage regulator